MKPFITNMLTHGLGLLVVISAAMTIVTLPALRL